MSDEEGHGITSAGQVTKGQLLLLDVRDGRIESEDVYKRQEDSH